MAAEVAEPHFGSARLGRDSGSEYSDSEFEGVEDCLEIATAQQSKDPRRGGIGKAEHRQLAKRLDKLAINKHDTVAQPQSTRIINCKSCSKWGFSTSPRSDPSTEKCSFCTSSDILVSKARRCKSQSKAQDITPQSQLLFSVDVYDDSFLVARNVLLLQSQCRTHIKFKNSLRNALAQEHAKDKHKIDTCSIRHLLPSEVFKNPRNQKMLRMGIKKGDEANREFHEWYVAALLYAEREGKPVPLAAKLLGDHSYMRDGKYGVKEDIILEGVETEKLDQKEKRTSQRPRRDDRSRSPFRDREVEVKTPPTALPH